MEELKGRAIEDEMNSYSELCYPIPRATKESIGEHCFTADSVFCPSPDQWSALNVNAAEVEVVQFLKALVLLTKPKYILETGTFHGLTALCMAKQLMENKNGGRIATIEQDYECYKFSELLFNKEGLENIDLIHGSSLEFIPRYKIDLLFLDSALEIRCDELRRFYPFLSSDATVVVHDTSHYHRVVIDGLKPLANELRMRMLNFRTPRGLAILKQI